MDVSLTGSSITAVSIASSEAMVESLLQQEQEGIARVAFVEQSSQVGGGSLKKEVSPVENFSSEGDGRRGAEKQKFFERQRHQQGIGMTVNSRSFFHQQPLKPCQAQPMLTQSHTSGLIMEI